MSALLEVEGLRIAMPTPNGPVTLVDGVDFSVEEGEVLGIAGESGSGKTMSVLALLRLLPRGAVVEGRGVYAGRDLLSLDRKGLGRVRGREIGMVFQDPATSLHPMMSVERTLTEQLRHHFKLSRRSARERATELLAEVRIPDPERSLSAYPHQFSGGMRQRIAIASALICGPKLLIADEPTTALDVTVQAGVIRLLDRLRDGGLTMILITHDLGVISSIADRLSVMYAGRVVESGTSAELLQRPRHPYTNALLQALPRPAAEDDRAPLRPIPGAPPSPQVPVGGCSFHPRCPHAVEHCKEAVPPLASRDGRQLACPVDPFARA